MFECGSIFFLLVKIAVNGFKLSDQYRINDYFKESCVRSNYLKVKIYKKKKLINYYFLFLI